MEGPKKRWLTSSWVSAGAATSGEVEASVSSGHGRRALGVPETSVVSRKELARQYRRQAYQRAKKARATDPKHLAMKEAAKLRRREVYQQVKEQRKVREAVLETKRKEAESQSRAVAKRELAERVKSAIGRGPEQVDGPGARGQSEEQTSCGLVSDPSRALARDIERALQNADVKELLDRLRAVSPGLAMNHRAMNHRAMHHRAMHHRDDDGAP